MPTKVIRRMLRILAHDVCCLMHLCLNMVACEQAPSVQFIQICAWLVSASNSNKAVILDIAMPVMNGYEVLENVKIDEKLMNIPIIVYSSEDGTTIENKVMKLGAHSFIRKPAPKTVLLDQVARLIEYSK